MPPGLLRLVPAPLRCCFLGLRPLPPAGPLLVSLSVFPNDWILGVTGLYPCGRSEAQEWLCGAGPGLLPPSLAHSPPFPPVWLAVQPPLSSPHLSNHRAPHLLLVNSGKEGGKEEKQKCGVAAGLGASLSDGPHGVEPGPGLGRRPRAGRSAGEQELKPQLPWARAGLSWEKRPDSRGAVGGGVGSTKGERKRGGLQREKSLEAQQNITHHPVQLPPFMDVKIEAQRGKVTCPR